MTEPDTVPPSPLTAEDLRAEHEAQMDDNRKEFRDGLRQMLEAVQLIANDQLDVRQRVGKLEAQVFGNGVR
jgi:hypothetical protein